jgi:ubiquinone/menaquinone biosynthesis C-methylase UbiE
MLRHHLVDMVEISRFMHRKPLGYAGDFMIMNYFYDYHNNYLGESSYEKLINSYACNIPVAISVVERKLFFKEKVLTLLANKPQIKVLSVASGSAREITELADEGKITKPLYFDCIDVETEALEHIKNKLENIPAENKKYLHVRFLHTDFMDLIKSRDVQNLFEKYDFIYSSGLFDYLPDKIANKLMLRLFKQLKEDGVLIVTNVKNDELHRPSYEMLCGWKLLHRNEQEVLAWANGIEGNNRVELINPNTIKPFMFLILELQKNPTKIFYK